MSCVDAPDLPDRRPTSRATASTRIPDYAWTDMTYLLHKHHVSWRYYVFKGTEPDCADDAAMCCKAMPQDAKTPGIWNPLPCFDTVRENWPARQHHVDCATSSRRRKAGSCRRSRGSSPTQKVSEHPPALVSARAGVRDDARSTRSCAAPTGARPRSSSRWDDWGGFYDHVVPPTVDQNELRDPRAGRS